MGSQRVGQDWATFTHNIIRNFGKKSHRELWLFKNYLFWAVLYLRCYAGFSLVAESGGHSSAAVRRLLSAVACLCCGAQALGCTGFGVCSVGS